MLKTDESQLPQSVSALQERIHQLEEDVQRLHKQLVMSQRLSSVGTIAFSITHEFNNILTTVINYARMGVRHKDDATRDKALDKILNAGIRASKITTSLLSYSRGQTERRDVTDLAQLVYDILVLAEKDLQVHRIKVETNLLEHPRVEVVASQIQQVVLNLIINARQAMNAGGVLTISVVPNLNEGLAEIRVSDTGSGIPKETLPRIFDPFFSTKTRDENGQGGSGIGLALCKDIIESHNGRIRVETAIGSGTTFIIKLPMIVYPNSATA
jgi:signal transduction histidine kinase